jgi:methyltransferase (TIGR00027 family)
MVIRMESGPSRTAMLAAMGRAMHVLTYGPTALVCDWLAYPMLGPEADSYVQRGKALAGEYAVDYATWHAARVRFAEDWMIASRAEQYVILGAGFDSFAWPQSGHIQAHEFDHPATQAWKRARLDALMVPDPPSLSMTAANFEEESVAEAIGRSAVDNRPLFVRGSGVIPYLTRDAIIKTLNDLPSCTAAISYALPLQACDASTRPFAEAIARAVADMGEPFLTLTTPEEPQRCSRPAGFEWRKISARPTSHPVSRIPAPATSGSHWRTNRNRLQPMSTA